MKQSALFTIILVLLFTSFAFLFQQSIRELNPEKEKDWWTLSFIRPDRNRNVDIVVTNYSENTSFSYQILGDNELISEGDFEAPLGENKVLLITPEKSFTQKHVIVRVKHKDETQELFRNYK
jgi:hypothetical protein